MITFITGAPGAGKTAYAVNEILTMLEKSESENKSSRMIITHAINGLKLPSRRVYCHSESCDPCKDFYAEIAKRFPDDEEKQKEIFAGLDYVENWHLWAPKNAIFLLDECQEIWPSYSDKKEPDAAVKRFEKHRHDGQDFIIMSQHPSFLSSHIQKLCSKHLHLTDSWGRRYQVEYDKVNNSLSEAPGVGRKSTYILPKKVFGLYKSSVGHHKVKRKKPAAVYALAFAVFMTALLGYRIVSSVYARTQDQTQAADETIGTNNGKTVSSTGGSQHDFQPRIAGMYETAPAYDQIRKVSDFPHIAGCAKNHRTGDCKCWTQQGTEYPTELQRCETWIKRPDFNPYREAIHEVRESRPIQEPPSQMAQAAPYYPHQTFVPFTGENYP